jgi:GntR family negative regulator for fad regulon and positive regulator of fabA
VGGFFFNHECARDIAIDYYQQLLAVLDSAESDKVVSVVRKYGIESGKIWLKLREDVPKNLVD